MSDDAPPQPTQQRSASRSPPPHHRHKRTTADVQLLPARTRLPENLEVVCHIGTGCFSHVYLVERSALCAAPPKKDDSHTSLELAPAANTKTFDIPGVPLPKVTDDTAATPPSSACSGSDSTGATTNFSSSGEPSPAAPSNATPAFAAPPPPPPRIAFAMKRLKHSTRDLSARRQQRIHDEISAWQSLCPHPNIVTFHGAFLDGDGHWCMVAEHMPSGSLSDLLRKRQQQQQQAQAQATTTELLRSSRDDDADDNDDTRTVPSRPIRQNDAHHKEAGEEKKADSGGGGGGFSEASTQAVMHHLLSAVAHMHAKGIAHRDIKPANILYNDGGGGGGSSNKAACMKLADFGLCATQQTPATELPNGGVGSYPWMAPEAFCGGHSGFPADLWSCGVVMYECLAGRLPFTPCDGATLHQTILLSESLEMPPLSGPCQDLLRRLLDPDAKGRPSAEGALRHKWFSGNAPFGDKPPNRR